MHDGQRRAFLGSFALLAVTALGFLGLDSRDIEARSRGRERFGIDSLRGSYASNGKADGFASRSVGVAYFDGRGNVVRTVRINANDGEGGRRLLDLSSVGTYTVDRNGIGVIQLTNTTDSGAVSDVTYDFVIRKSERGSSDDGPQALVIAAIQREPGITASLIEESFTYQFDD